MISMFNINKERAEIMLGFINPMKSIKLMENPKQWKSPSYIMYTICLEVDFKISLDEIRLVNGLLEKWHKEDRENGLLKKQIYGYPDYNSLNYCNKEDLEQLKKWGLTEDWPLLSSDAITFLEHKFKNDKKVNYFNIYEAARNNYINKFKKDGKDVRILERELVSEIISKIK